MRVKVCLDTLSNIKKFVEVTERIPERITLEDGNGHVVSATSILGAVYTMEWECVYCCCDRDITGKILPWLV